MRTTTFGHDIDASRRAEKYPSVIAALLDAFPGALQVHRAHQQIDQLGDRRVARIPGRNHVRRRPENQEHRLRSSPWRTDGRRVGADLGIELVISLPVGFQRDARAFFVDSLAWVRSTIPQPVTIIAAVVHRDETAEHMHVVLVVARGPERVGAIEIEVTAPKPWRRGVCRCALLELASAPGDASVRNFEIIDSFQPEPQENAGAHGACSLIGPLALKKKRATRDPRDQDNPNRWFYKKISGYTPHCKISRHHLKCENVRIAQSY